MLKHKVKPNDKGYVIAFVAILLIPILGFTSFSVDLGSWYAKAAEIQKAADAAALAGAAFLPDTNRAEAKAKEVAAVNGFNHDDPEVTVTVFIPPADPKTISVSISIAEFPRYFSQVLENENISLTRTSRAEYLPAPRMGSPRNFLGTGNCPGGATGLTSANEANGPFGIGCAPLSVNARENWWLGINYACTPRESGDRFASYIDGTGTGIDGQESGGGNDFTATRLCQTRTRQTFDYMRTSQQLNRYLAVNPEYNPDGYYFGITLKSPPGGAQSTYYLEGFSMGLGQAGGPGQQCIDGPAILQEYEGDLLPVEVAARPEQAAAQNALFKTKWRLYDNGAFDPRVPVPPSGVDFEVTVDANNCALYSGWHRFQQPLTVAAGETKTYWLQVQPSTYEQIKAELGNVTPEVIKGRGVNVFSLRVSGVSSFAPCSSLEGDLVSYSSTCPEVYAVEHLPTFASFTLDENFSTRDFFLAQLPDEYVNRTVSVEVFDPDPFTRSIRIGRSGNIEYGDFQEFQPSILCRDGAMAQKNSGICNPYPQEVSGGVVEVAENPPRNVAPGAGGLISYNNMLPTTSFDLFQGPAPLPVVDADLCVQGIAPNPTYIPGCNLAGNTWFNSASNTNKTNSNAISGLSTRTLRMSYQLNQRPAQTTNDWWKIQFVVSGEGQNRTLPTDRMTWTLRVSGEPVRLLPNQIP